MWMMQAVTRKPVHVLRSTLTERQDMKAVRTLHATETCKVQKQLWTLHCFASHIYPPTEGTSTDLYGHLREQEASQFIN